MTLLLLLLLLLSVGSATVPFLCSFLHGTGTAAVGATAPTILSGNGTNLVIVCIDQNATDQFLAAYQLSPTNNSFFFVSKLSGSPTWPLGSLPPFFIARETTVSVGSGSSFALAQTAANKQLTWGLYRIDWDPNWVWSAVNASGFPVAPMQSPYIFPSGADSFVMQCELWGGSQWQGSVWGFSAATNVWKQLYRSGVTSDAPKVLFTLFFSLLVIVMAL